MSKLREAIEAHTGDDREKIREKIRGRLESEGVVLTHSEGFSSETTWNLERLKELDFATLENIKFSLSGKRFIVGKASFVELFQAEEALSEKDYQALLVNGGASAI